MEKTDYTKKSEQEATLLIARNLKELEVDTEIISKATGLTPKEIEKIELLPDLSEEENGREAKISNRLFFNLQGNGFNRPIAKSQIREQSKAPITIEDEECPEDFIIDYPKGNANPFTYPLDDDSCYFLYLTNRKKAFSKLTSIKPNPWRDDLPPEFNGGYTNLHIYKRCCLWYKGICHFNAYDESESEYRLYYFILYRDKDGVLQKKRGSGIDYKEVLEIVHNMTLLGYHVYSCIGAILIEDIYWH
ncbi:MAG: hypothetical protein J6Y37_00485 [Paludibacteraceae bacterium]|nr:hypothetical protein [Paludibacteraceae bacterium]